LIVSLKLLKNYLPEQGPPATPIRKGVMDALDIVIDDLE
jgi:hypothetical protein